VRESLAHKSELVAPQYLWVPDHVSTCGTEAIELAEQCGITLDPEQKLAINAIMAEDSAGQWVSLEACVIEPRQNGKTGGIVLPVVLADVFILGSGLIVWTSHRFRTSEESFRELVQVIQGNPDLDRRIKRISNENGSEGIEFINGSRVDFLARSKGSGRGLTGDRVVLDEAFDLSAAEMGSLLPTLSARPNPQVIYASSAGQEHSDVLRSIRDRGRAGNDPSLTYLEWCAPPGQCGTTACTHALHSPRCVLDDETRWQQANPAMGRRISVSFIRAERRAMAAAPDEFARERLGWWDDPVGMVPISAKGFAALILERDKPNGTPVFFINVAPGMRSASIGVAVRQDDITHVELADHRTGTDWLPQRCKELADNTDEDAVFTAWSAGAVGSMLPDLEAVGIKPELFSTHDMGRACGHLQKAVRDKTLTHSGDPLLLMALAGAAARDMGEGLWLWDRKKSTADISPLWALTGALWGNAIYGPDRSPVPQFYIA
jgi:phage terminase large subunit-like protein